jgi:hypothetical protein
MKIIVNEPFFDNSSFNVPRLAARRRTGMTREGQRIVRLMLYLTPRVVSPPRPYLVVASLRRVPAHNYNKPYTQNSIKPEPCYAVPASAGTAKHVASCVLGYPIPCLGKGSPPLSLGGGLALCVSAGFCGSVFVLDRVTRLCFGVGEASIFRLLPVIACGMAFI